jgi:hypothetical protein
MNYYTNISDTGIFKQEIKIRILVISEKINHNKQKKEV